MADSREYWLSKLRRHGVASGDVEKLTVTELGELHTCLVMNLTKAEYDQGRRKTEGRIGEILGSWEVG